MDIFLVDVYKVEYALIADLLLNYITTNLIV